MTGSTSGAVIGVVTALHRTHSEIVAHACSIFQFGLLVAVPGYVFFDDGTMAKIATVVFLLVTVIRLSMPGF